VYGFIYYRANLLTIPTSIGYIPVLEIWEINKYKYKCILQTGHITLSSTPDQQLENHSTKYHRQ